MFLFSSEPQPVRSITKEIIYSETENYNASLYLSLTPPCHMYGHLSKYTITLRELGSDGAGGKELNGLQTTYEINGLKPECNYSLTVAVSNVHHTSAPLVELFSTPPGGKYLSVCTIYSCFPQAPFPFLIV